MFRSTSAFLVEGAVERRGQVWAHVLSGARFDAAREEWRGGEGQGPRPLTGMDTFWVTWSLAHLETLVLTPGGPRAASGAPAKSSQPAKPSQPTKPSSRPAKRWF